MTGFTERYNLHTHSFYCGHGIGTISDYCNEAERLGLEILGFSEHCPRPDSFMPQTRMPGDDMTLYEKDCREEGKRRAFTIILGYECDYEGKHYSYYDDLLATGRVDYLISGTHYIKRNRGEYVTPFVDRLTGDDLKTYRDEVVEAISSGLFSFIAHPDLFMAGYEKWDKACEEIASDIVSAAIDNGIPLEVNGNGYVKPHVFSRQAYGATAEFFDVAKARGAILVRNTDAHTPKNLGLSVPMMKAFMDGHGYSLAKVSVEDGKPCFKA